MWINLVKRRVTPTPAVWKVPLFFSFLGMGGCESGTQWRSGQSCTLILWLLYIIINKTISVTADIMNVIGIHMLRLI